MKNTPLRIDTAIATDASRIVRKEAAYSWHARQSFRLLLHYQSRPPVIGQTLAHYSRR